MTQREFLGVLVAWVATWAVPKAKADVQTVEPEELRPVFRLRPGMNPLRRDPAAWERCRMSQLHKGDVVMMDSLQSDWRFTVSGGPWQNGAGVWGITTDTDLPSSVRRAKSVTVVA